MHLFVDCETSDLPKRWNASAGELSNWPRVVQLAWILCDGTGNELLYESRLIKPDGFRISPGAFRTHGISTEHAIEHGEDLENVLLAFQSAIQESEQVVAHNIQFDSMVVGAEFLRREKKNPFNRIMQRCTMKESADYCRLPSRHGYKWPKLEELYKILFKKELLGAHDAGADCRACKDCFYRLRELEAIVS